MTVAVKICGLSDEAALHAAVEAGAAMTGFVFFERSPRNVSPACAAELGSRVPTGILKVGLTVDADDELLAEITAAGMDMLQLHGHETPERVREVKERFGLPVMKAVPVGDAGDLEAARAYEDVCDRLMFDAKPPEGAERPGGNARAFEWALLKGTTWKVPWLLAGGLTAENLADAVAASGAEAVDVSSGVEDAPGRKNPALIKAFLAAAMAL